MDLFNVFKAGLSLAQRLPLPALAAAAMLASCATEPPVGVPASLNPADAQAFISRAMPRTVSDRAGWTRDIYDGLTIQGVERSRENICAVVAVIAQESGFQVNPVVPGLPQIAWREIDRRAEHAGLPLVLLHTALKLPSSSGLSYGERINAARTEKDLSDIYEDFIAAVPLGEQLFAERNPIRTRGPMQVNIAFAKEYAAVKPYPYPMQGSLADELFTRRGSIYFGIAHLFAYSAPYDSYLYRFADFNAGQYASRNAAFQQALSEASGMHLVADGALLPPDSVFKGVGSTELAARMLAPRLHMSESAVHRALEQAKNPDFERSMLYQRAFEAADRTTGRPLPRAAVPHIELKGPKITHRLTTDWYAHRVDLRFKQCLGR